MNFEEDCRIHKNEMRACNHIYSVVSLILLHDLVSGCDIKPCIKMDKPLVVYIFFKVCNDIHSNVTYI